MSEPIVVGTDGSAGADRAVQWAAAEAALRGRRLHIVHSIDKGLFALPLFAHGGPDHEVAEAAEELLARAARLARERSPGIEVSTEPVADSSARVLGEWSERAFEVVVGHRGRGGFAGLPLGSTGLRLAGQSAAPVVIVRGEPGAGRGAVVVGLDLLSDPEETLRYAFEAAAARGARLRALHAWRPGETSEAAGPDIGVTDVEERLRWEVVEAHAPWRKAYPGVGVSEEILQEHPVTALTDASEGADLVVVGSHDHRFGLARLGSVSHGVIHHAHCPVAVTRVR